MPGADVYAPEGFFDFALLVVARAVVIRGKDGRSPTAESIAYSLGGKAIWDTTPTHAVEVAARALLLALETPDATIIEGTANVD